MTSVERFRELFYSVAPLNTYSTSPYINGDNGVFIEGTVVVYKNKIVPLSEVGKLEKSIDRNLDSNKAPVNVALLYFSENHTTRPDSNSLGNF